MEKNRFSAMKNAIQTLRAPERQVQTVTRVQKSTEVFSLEYTYPKCPELKCIKGKRIFAYSYISNIVLRYFIYMSARLCPEIFQLLHSSSTNAMCFFFFFPSSFSTYRLGSSTKHS